MVLGLLKQISHVRVRKTLHTLKCSPTFSQFWALVGRAMLFTSTYYYSSDIENQIVTHTKLYNSLSLTTSFRLLYRYQDGGTNTGSLCRFVLHLSDSCWLWQNIGIGDYLFDTEHALCCISITKIKMMYIPLMSYGRIVDCICIIANTCP